ncbi:MAG: hypothetical protein RLZZ596_1472 [Pseudomonadota bacterium]
MLGSDPLKHIEHGGWTATVKLIVSASSSDNLLNVQQGASKRIHMQVQAAMRAGQDNITHRIQESRLIHRTHSVVQCPTPAQCLQAGDHGRNRGDADPTRDQHAVRRSFIKPEVLPRVANLQGLAYAQLFMNPA